MNRISAIIILIAAILIIGCTERVVYTDIFNEDDMIPVFKTPGGTYHNEQYVTITTVVEGTTIRYTLDGTIPGDSSAVYSDTLYVSMGKIINAEAFKPGWNRKSSQAEYKFQIATPSFNPPAGAYDSPQFVELHCETNQVTIRYTTDGSEPDTTSTLYSEPILVSRDTTLKATAFRTRWLNSEIATASFHSAPVAAPTFEPSGGEYFEPQNVTINCATEGATVRYTTDGTEPDSSSNIYTSPIAVTVNTTVKARAFKNDWGNTSQSEYGLIVANPTFNPPAGDYDSPQFVEIFCETPETVIRYTDDGSEPNTSSTLYSEPILVNRDTTLKAKAYRTGWYDSQTATSSYQPLSVATPTFDPPGGEYIEPQRVTISCATGGATIRYTVDGTEPDTTSSIYTEPIDITKNTTIKARAFKKDWGNTSRSEYSLIVSKPTFDLPGGEYPEAQVLTIKSATAGATIRYTTDGNDPTPASTVYSAPIDVDGNMTLKARAFKGGWTPSAVTQAEFSFTVVTPTITPPEGVYYEPQRVTINCATQGATIRYTANGTEPTSTSAIYSEPIVIPLNTTLKARGFKEGWTASQTVSVQYSQWEDPFEIVFVEGGTFKAHVGYTVILSSFYMGKYDVTQSEYQAVMGTNPSYFTGNPNRPVETVSWFNAIEYCNRLSMMEGLTPCYNYSDVDGHHGTNPANWPAGWNTNDANNTNVTCSWNATGYRLPTEMEWLFAAKGGVLAQYAGTDWDGWAGTDVEDQLVNYAWYQDNAGPGLPGGSDHPDYGTHPVGEKLPNELGLYDMSGNVANWVWDIRGHSYPRGVHYNPKGETTGTNRLFRGGSWYYSAAYCRVFTRRHDLPSRRYYYYGFRCVRRIP